MKIEDEALLDVRATAHLLNVHESKVYDMAKGGRLPVVRVGASLRFQRTALMDWIEQQTTVSPGARQDEAR